MIEVSRETLSILFALIWTVSALGVFMLAAGLVNIWGDTGKVIWVELALVALAWGIAAATIAGAPWLEARDPLTLTLLCCPMAVATVRAAWLVWTSRHDP